MYKVTIFMILFAVFALTLAAPEPECQMSARPQGKSKCESLSRNACTTKVTSKFTQCRRAFVRFCMSPEGVEDTESCLRSRCDTIPGDKHHSKHEMKTECRKGLRSQCSDQVCDDEPLSEPEPEGDCEIHAAPLSKSECESLSKNACTTRVTSKFTQCRRAFVKFCTAPSGVDSTESCLRARCDTIPGDKHHSKNEMKTECRKGLRKQCEMQVWDCAEEGPEKAPEEHECEGPNGEAFPNGSTKSKCESLAKSRCGTKVTSKFTNCRRRFVEFCTEPEPVDDKESCLQARCDTIPGDKWHSKKEMKDTCRNGLNKQCDDQICREPTTRRAPTTTTKRTTKKRTTKKRTTTKKATPAPTKKPTTKKPTTKKRTTKKRTTKKRTTKKRTTKKATPAPTTKAPTTLRRTTREVATRAPKRKKCPRQATVYLPAPVFVQGGSCGEPCAGKGYDDLSKQIRKLTKSVRSLKKSLKNQAPCAAH